MPQPISTLPFLSLQESWKNIYWILIRLIILTAQIGGGGAGNRWFRQPPSLCWGDRAGCRPGVEDEVPRVAEEYGGNVLYEGAVGDFLVISRSALHAVRYPLSPKLFLLSVISTKYQPVV